MLAGAEAKAPEISPGLFMRLGAGAWHVPAGFVFLLRNPPLWPLAILPAALAALCLALGLVAGYFSIPPLESLLIPGRDRVPDWLNLVLTLVLWAGALAAGMALGLAVALLLSAPALERLSRQVEARVRGRASDLSRGTGWELAQSLRGALYFLAAAPGILLLSVLPLVGPLLGALWGAHALAFQQTEAPLARRGLDFASRREWHRCWKAESLGFGLAGLVTLVVPLANLLLTPVLAVGGTLLVLELEEGLPPDPA